MSDCAKFLLIGRLGELMREQDAQLLRSQNTRVVAKHGFGQRAGCWWWR